MKTLCTLIQLAEKKLEDHQKIMALCEEEIKKVEQKQKDIEHAREQGFKLASRAGKDHIQYKAAGSYQNRAEQEQMELTAVKTALIERLAELKQQLNHLFAEKKKLEIIADNKQKAAEKSKKRKETKELDEISSQIHRRKTEEDQA